MGRGSKEELPFIITLNSKNQQAISHKVQTTILLWLAFLLVKLI